VSPRARRTGAADELGAHVKVAGGLDLCFERAAEVGARAIQIFVKNQRQWAARPLSAAAIAAFRAARRRSPVRAVFAHGTYLLNLASPDGTIFGRSVETLAEELRRATALGLEGVIFHPGSSPLGRAAGIARICEGIDRVVAAAGGEGRGQGQGKGRGTGKGGGRGNGRGGADLILETTPGGGNQVGARIEDLERIVAGVSDEARRRLAICVDTCHVFVAGYDIREPEVYEALVEEIERRLGLGRVRAFHLNDSRGELGSRVDRHANIGRGRLGTAPFARLLADRRFAGVPKIVETPVEDDGHRRDLETLRSLRKGA